MNQSTPSKNTHPTKPIKPVVKPKSWWTRFNPIKRSIGFKIILPYLLLTIFVAAVGVFIVTNFVTGSLNERLDNQLLDAGRIVSNSMLEYESLRLSILRNVAFTEGVPEALDLADMTQLGALVPQILSNSQADVVVLLNREGDIVYGWDQLFSPTEQGVYPWAETAFAHKTEVKRAITGQADVQGDKWVFLADTVSGYILFTIGPVYNQDDVVGVVMVGTDLHKMLINLTETAVARVSVYSREGQVLRTTLSDALPDEPSGRYAMVISHLEDNANESQVILLDNANNTTLGYVNLPTQQYKLAYGEWRLRGQSFGLFSVALPTNFITNTAINNQLGLSVLFGFVSILVCLVGLWLAQLIVQPLNQLVHTSVAIAHGNLGRRTQLDRDDEFGTLAHSFDVMTDNLVERNQQLLEQASQLETIVHSIADGILVLDLAGNVVSSNPTAEQVLKDMSAPMHQNFLKEIPDVVSKNGAGSHEATDLSQAKTTPTRYSVGTRVFSALSSPMMTKDGQALGTVVVLRDVTRDVEAEDRQDIFITSVSHELRTPLMAIKGYTNLLLKFTTETLDANNLNFIEKIDSNADRMTRHVNKLIDIAEIQTGKLALQKKQFSFSKMVQEATTLWCEKIKTRDLALQLDLDDTDLFINGDQERLAWAVDNLLNNAYQYTEMGQITVCLFEENGEVRLDITDTGVGIPATDQPYVFDRFFRANEHHPFAFSVDGVGLGLFVAKSIVQLHEGRIWLQSTSNQGSTFSLALNKHEVGHF